MKRLAFVLLISCSCHAQIIRVDMGGSTLGMSGGGASVSAFFPRNTVAMSGGVIGGRVVGGLSDSFRFKGSDVTLGTQQLGASIDGGGVAVQGIGGSLVRKRSGTEIGIFAGSIGTGFMLPYVSSVIPEHAGAAAFVRHRWNHLRLGAVAANAGGTTVLGSASWSDRRLDATVVGGILNGQKFSSATATYHPTLAWSAYANHYDTFSPVRAMSDSVGASWNTSHASLSGGVVHSAFGFGENASASLRWAGMTNTVSAYESRRTLILTDTMTEKVSRHLSFSETIADVRQSRSISFGGEYTSNRLSCGVSQGVGYFPLTGTFDRVTSVHVSFVIRGSRMSATVVSTPSMKPQYQVAGEKFTQGPIATSATTNIHRRTGGKFLISGVVTDATGRTLEGVAVVAGSDVLFTNRQGKFETRTKTAKPVTVTVDLDQTVTAGTWSVKTCPQTVTPAREGAAQSVTILLVRP